MDDIFDETSDDLTIARHDGQLIETLRYTDSFRDAVETSEQDAFETGFLRGYKLISTLVYDFYLEKERLSIEDVELKKEFQLFESEFQSTINQLKIADEITEEQQIETIKILRLKFDEILLKTKLQSVKIQST